MGTDTRKRPRGQAPVSRDPVIVTNRILDAAQAEFMEAGYDGANTNRIVQRLGGSKATLFRHFPTKRALMEAVIRRIASRWPDEVKWERIEATEPREWLHEFGLMALKWILGEDKLFLGWIGIAERRSLPGTAKIFHAAASRPLEKLLESRLRDWTSTGLVASTTPGVDAARFFDLVLAGAVSRRLYGLGGLRTASAMQAYVAHAVDLFLYGVAGSRPATGAGGS